MTGRSESRLRSQHADLADALGRLGANSIDMLRGLVDDALADHGVVVSNGQDEGSLAALVERLDEAGFDAADRAGHDGGSEEYARAFESARAANALLYLVRGDAEEATYELLAATGGDVQKVLRGLNGHA